MKQILPFIFGLAACSSDFNLETALYAGQYKGNQVKIDEYQDQFQGGQCSNRTETRHTTLRALDPSHQPYEIYGQSGLSLDGGAYFRVMIQQTPTGSYAVTYPDPTNPRLDSVGEPLLPETVEAILLLNETVNHIRKQEYQIPLPPTGY